MFSATVLLSTTSFLLQVDATIDIIGEALQAFACGCGCKFYDVGTCETRVKTECEVREKLWENWENRLLCTHYLVKVVQKKTIFLFHSDRSSAFRASWLVVFERLFFSELWEYAERLFLL